MTQKPYLNLGCGRVILPAPKPAHYGLIEDGVCDYALWHNVDRNAQPGVDETLDLFRYPWPWADNSYDGALVAHVAEHIPHEIQLDESDVYPLPEDTPAYRRLMAFYARRNEVRELQDGWFAFFAELHRVLTPGSLIHILSPYGWSSGGITDPTHTRLLTPDSFTHSMQPDPNAPFAYATGGLNLQLLDARLAVTPEFQHLLAEPERLQHLLNAQLNVAHEFAVKLRVIK